MSPEIVRYSRIIRVLVLIIFGIYMMTRGTTIGYFFAVACAIFTGLTAYLLYISSR